MDIIENGDEVMMPGFRFHPTDEELVNFYLKRKIQQRPLCIELIRQLDIYKYNPWDLPKLATTGEKEFYFYCPRDRKYRNSARPNRVTEGGFWKATGTDRPIYSSDGNKCIGLKKSLVFYKGRAAKGTKTDWMMHEFRLPSLADVSGPRRPLDHKNIPSNESWAICRIFKKNTNFMAQRAIFRSWNAQFQDTTTESGFLSVSKTINANQFVSENVSYTTEPSSSILFNSNNDINFPPLEIDKNFKSTNFMFSPDELSLEAMLLDFSQQPQESNDFAVNCPSEFNGEAEKMSSNTIIDNEMPTISFPFSLTTNISDDWKLNLPWDAPLYPSMMSTNYTTNICYT